MCVCVSSDTPTLKRETLYVSLIEMDNHVFLIINVYVYRMTFSDCCAFSLNRIVIITFICLRCSRRNSQGVIRAEPECLSQLLSACWISSVAE